VESKPWKILIVDDDEDVHEITRLALRRRSWRARHFETTHARSAKEGKQLLKTYGMAFQVAVVDVVMETDQAGLELCQYIRSTFGSQVRIVLRTGQPGVAPEEHVLNYYDIDTYLAKSTTTEDSLFAAIRSSLRTLEDLSALEAANATLTVINAELARQNEFRQKVLSQLAGGGVLGDVLAHLSAPDLAGNFVPAEWRAKIKRAREELKDLLRPSDFVSIVQQALRHRNVLLLLGESKALRLTRGALAGAHTNTRAADSWEEALASLRTGAVDLLFVDWEHMGVLNEALRFNSNLIAVLLTTQPQFEQHGSEILALPITSALIINTILDVQKVPDALMIEELVITAGKLITDDIFGLEKYLSWGVTTHERRISDSEHRFAVADELGVFIDKCDMRDRHKSAILTLADELMMNAIYDAPVGEDGKPKYAHLPRTERVMLTKREEVTLRYATDGNRVAVSVSDNYGRLTRDTAFSYICKCFAHEGAQVDFKTDGRGGTGIGLAMSYMAMSGLVINVDPSARTEVIGIIKIREGARMGPERPRSFHYFCKAGGGGPGGGAGA